mgnify:CR=1 FL=1
MENKAGAQISKKAFTQSVIILAVIMLAAGVMTRVIPAGSFQRAMVEGREMLVPDSYQRVQRPDYPAWRWLTAPVEVLWGEDSLLVIAIIFFILFVGGSFAVLEKSGILEAGLGWIVNRFQGRKYQLLMVISFFFMLLGAFFGIFEEVVPLVPLALALAHYLGWDPLVGLGMSILATNLGFSAAITNPFTLGVAQEIAGLPLFSGAWLRIPIFLVMYGVLAVFLVRYARRVEADPGASLVVNSSDEHQVQQPERVFSVQSASSGGLKRGTRWLGFFLILILLVLVGIPFVPLLADYALPLVGVLFLMAGVGAGLLSQSSSKEVFRALREGVGGIAPGIILILMAVSVKHIVVQGGVMDTVLHAASRPLAGSSPLVSSLMIYLLALLMEFFVASGSAKAFLLMPILLPLADLVGVTRQIAVTAYSFGDGFSNTIYPTNPVLLIALGLSVVSYPRWLRWTLPLWGVVFLISLLFLALAVSVGYGPF